MHTIKTAPMSNNLNYSIFVVFWAYFLLSDFSFASAAPGAVKKVRRALGWAINYETDNSIWVKLARSCGGRLRALLRGQKSNFSSLFLFSLLFLVPQLPSRCQQSQRKGIQWGSEADAPLSRKLDKRRKRRRIHNTGTLFLLLRHDATVLLCDTYSSVPFNLYFIFFICFISYFLFIYFS